jgi:hypothetical protein
VSAKQNHATEGRRCKSPIPRDRYRDPSTPLGMTRVLMDGRTRSYFFPAKILAYPGLITL